MSVFAQVDTGGGYATLNDTVASGYHRETAGRFSAGATTTISVSDGDKFRVIHDRSTGTTNIDTVANYSKLMLTRLA